jgi:hypothetical protein
MPEQEEIRHSDGRIEHPAVRYERRDIAFRGLLAVLVASVCVIAGVFYVVWHLYWSEAAMQAEAGRSPYPLAPAPSTKLSREPRLEQVDHQEHAGGADFFPRQAAKEKLLQTYGPTEDKGFVRIPIAEAMKSLAGQRPVAGRPPQSQHKQDGLLDAGEPNSGRVYRGESP